MPTQRCALIIGGLALAILACGDPTPPVAPGDVSLEVTGGAEQVGLEGQELSHPIVVKVTGPNGKPAQGVLINFVVTAGGGHVFAGSALTTAAGEARERWTLGSLGDNVLEARSVDQTTGEPVVHAQIHATAVTPTPGEPATYYIPPEYRSQYRVIGHTVDVRDFIFVNDANRTPVLDPPFTLSADPGFVIDGPTVRADPAAGVVVGTVRFSVAGMRDSFELGFLPDFTGRRWRASYGCLAGNVHYDMDSIVNVVAVSDSVRQAEQELFVQMYSALELTIYMQASGTIYYRDGRVVEGPLPSQLAQNITARVFPSRIEYGRLVNWWHSGAGGMRWSSGSWDGNIPPTYEGGHMCDDIFENFKPGLLEPLP